MLSVLVKNTTHLRQITYACLSTTLEAKNGVTGLLRLILFTALGTGYYINAIIIMHIIFIYK